VIVDQFNAYEILDGVTVNGRLTIGENIADLGGLTIAWDALHEALPADPPLVGGATPQERFLTAFAVMWRTNTTEAYARLLARIDTHAPARFRVNGPLANFPPFAATFGVPEGSPMARPGERRARIW
jgi:putative endopeptidase